MSIKRIATWSIAAVAFYTGFASYSASVFSSHQFYSFKHLNKQPGVVVSVDSQTSDLYNRKQVLKLSLESPFWSQQGLEPWDSKPVELFIRHERTVWPFYIQSSIQLEDDKGWFAATNRQGELATHKVTLDTNLLTGSADLNLGRSNAAQRQQNMQLTLDLDDDPLSLTWAPILSWINQLSIES